MLSLMKLKIMLYIYIYIVCCVWLMQHRAVVPMPAELSGPRGVANFVPVFSGGVLSDWKSYIFR